MARPASKGRDKKRRKVSKRQRRRFDKTAVIPELQGDTYAPAANSPPEDGFGETVADPELGVDSMADTEHCQDEMELTVVNRPRFSRRKEPEVKWKSEIWRDFALALSVAGTFLLLYLLGRKLF